MSQWLEEKYISLVGSQLGHFHKQSRTTYGFRCPFCGDSQKRANKTRGYFFLHKGQYFYKCHNCNISMTLRGFLRKHAPQLFQEYQLDSIRQSRPEPPSVAFHWPTPSGDTLQESINSSIGLPTIASLPDDHCAVQYCRGRGLPTAALHHLYFTDEWTDWIRKMEWSYALPEDHAPRLILPWFNRQHILLGAQARRIDATGAAARYVTLKQHTCDDKIYGWDRLDLHKLIYVVEGPLDSWFLSNAVASMDADLLRLRDKYFSHHAAVYVWDNEPRNKAVVANLQRAIADGVSVVVWPDWVREKDLNEMSQAGYTINTLIQEHTYQGLRASLEFQRWNRLK